MNKTIAINDMYTRSTILDFIKQIGVKTQAKYEVIEVEKCDQKEILLFALGISTDELNQQIAKKRPAIFNIVRISLFGVILLGAIFMIIDMLFRITGLYYFAYVFLCLCCISLLITNEIAIKEWNAKNGKFRKKHKFI